MKGKPAKYSTRKCDKVSHPMGCFRSYFHRPVNYSFALRQIVKQDDIPISGSLESQTIRRKITLSDTRWMINSCPIDY